MSNDSVKEAQDVPNLPKLLAALAAGARSVNALPKAPQPKDGDNDSESEHEADDEFAYQMAFSEFKNICLDSRSEVASLLNQSLQSTASAADNMVDDYNFDDPVLWETAAEACDILLERVDQYIQNEKEGRIGRDGEIVGEIVRDFARNRGGSGFDQIVGSLVDMEVSSSILQLDFIFLVKISLVLNTHLSFRNHKILSILPETFKILEQILLFLKCTPRNLSRQIHPSSSNLFQAMVWQVDSMEGLLMNIFSQFPMIS